MTDQPSNPNLSGRLSEAARRDRICDQFAAAWHAGERPRIEDCLAEMPEASRPALLRELLAVELENRSQAGERPIAEEYQRRFPDHRGIVDEITGESLSTCQSGDRTQGVARGDHDGRRWPIRLNCPHCHNPVEVERDAAANDALCPSCGSAFQLDPGRTYSWSQEKLPQLGKFKLIEAVGRGAFGTVYRAIDTELDRVVAVKVPRTGRLVTPGDEDRFVREARSVAQLRHPAIVPVYEVGRTDAFPYIATEFVEGVDLAEALSARGFSFREAAELMVQVAEALDHAHSQRVVHRDLKPSNIMLERDAGLATRVDESPGGGSTSSGGSANAARGSRRAMRFRTEFVPRIMDFGLAKRDAGEVTMTLDGQVLGTPAYMSPEQVRDPHCVDGRSDLYSLGVILYQLTTGELPFRGVTRMLLNQVLHDEPRPPRRLNDRIPRDLETITLKCMAKDRDRRYATAADVAADLRRWLGGEPIHARPVSRPERLWRWCKRNPVVSSLAAALAAAIFIGSVGVTSQWIRAEQKAAETGRALRQAEASLYFNQIALADREWHAGSVASAEARLEACPTPARHWEWGYLKRLCHLDRLTLGGHARPVFGVAFSRDGRRIASASGDSSVRIWDAATGDTKLILRGHTAAAMSVAFSPDDRQIASASGDQTVKLWDSNTGRELVTLRGHQNTVTCVVFSSDGGRIASASLDGTVKLWDTATGKEELSFGRHEGGVLCVAFRSDDGRIVSGGEDKTVRLWDPATGEELFAARGHNRKITCVAVSPDGGRIASGSQDQTLRLWDAATGREALTLRGHSAFVLDVAFSPDGRRVATSSGDETVKIWDPTTGEEVQTLRGHTRPVRSLRWGPDGRQIVSGGDDRTVKLWDTAAVHESLALRGHGGPIWSASFSADGRRVVSASEDGTLKVWDSASGKEIANLAGHRGAVRDAVFSPDGLRLVSGCVDQTVKLWNVATAEEIYTLSGHSDSVLSVAFSPDGRRIASAGGDGSARIWDAATGKQSVVLLGHQGPVASVAFSPDGRQMVTGSLDQTVRTWDAETGDEDRVLMGHLGPVLSVAFSPDGKQVASASRDQTVRLWNAATGRERLVLQGHSIDVRSVAFSPDGRRIASAGGDLTLKLWDVATGMEACTLRGHDLPIERIAFSLDGRRIATASGDRTVRLWEAIGWLPD